MKLLFFALLFLPVSFVSAQELNAGFVQGLWYSKVPFFAGETVRIYTAIQNNSGFDITGTVTFLDNGESVGESVFSAVNGRIVEVWTDWEVTQGNHSVGANIKEALKVEVGKEPESISLGNALLGESQVFADEDTDKDNVGNLQDADDDNDLVPDETEEALGTNPLDPDTDHDGLQDGQEIDMGTNPLDQDTDQDGVPDAKDSDPLSKEQAAKEILTEPARDSVVAKTAEKLTKEYLPSLVQEIDSLVQETTEKLQEQRQEFKEKKEAFATGESSEPLSTKEQTLDFFLASAIVALPQWQLGLFLFFAIAAALLLRKLASKT